jgi:hypothetical protein
MSSAADLSDTDVSRRLGRIWARVRLSVQFDGASSSVLYAIIGVLVAASLTLLGWQFTSQRELDRGNEAFTSVAADTRQALRNRLNNYATALDGAAALHAASSKVSADEWETYVTSLDLDRTLSSIKDIGYVEPVKRTGAEAFIRQAREDGWRLSTIHPASDRNELLPIKYIAPTGANRAALGLDIAFEGNRAAALRQSRSTGELTITSKINLVQDSKQGPGWSLPFATPASGFPLTANAFAEDVENCLAAGMQAHCSKPLSMAQFEQVMRRWLPGGGGPGLVEVAA